MSRKTRKDEPFETGEEGLPWWRRPGRGTMLSLLTLSGLIVAAVFGLERLKGRVASLPEYVTAPKVELVDTPKWLDQENWRQYVLASIHLPAKTNWLDGKLVQDVGRQLTESGWASRIKRITRDVHGTIRISCEYRRPIAMVRLEQAEADGYPSYVAIDKDRVRLPQVYRDAGQFAWMEIIGLEAAVPEPGQAFQGGDAKAAVDLVQLLSRQPFARQIRAVDVSNFHGRKDRRQDHIYLLARGRSKPITWGSAIGDEFEENDVELKLRLIAKTLKNGSPNALANVSCYPDRVIMRPDAGIQTADGSQLRGR